MVCAQTIRYMRGLLNDIIEENRDLNYVETSRGRYLIFKGDNKLKAIGLIGDKRKPRLGVPIWISYFEGDGYAPYDRKHISETLYGEDAVKREFAKVLEMMNS